MTREQYQAACESWDRFCKESDEQVKAFDGKEHESCPCCGHPATAYWNYDGNYDPYFVIECTTCSCHVKSYSWEKCIEEWEGHRIPKKREAYFVLHEYASMPISASQRGETDNLTIFTDIEKARERFDEIADGYKNMRDFKRSGDEFTCQSGGKTCFYRVWIETVHAKKDSEKPRESHWGFLSYDEGCCSKCGNIIFTHFDTTNEAREKWNELPKYCGECGARMERLSQKELDKIGKTR